MPLALLCPCPVLLCRPPGLLTPTTPSRGRACRPSPGTASDPLPKCRGAEVPPAQPTAPEVRLSPGLCPVLVCSISPGALALLGPGPQTSSGASEGQVQPPGLTPQPTAQSRGPWFYLPFCDLVFPSVKWGLLAPSRGPAREVHGAEACKACGLVPGTRWVLGMPGMPRPVVTQISWCDAFTVSVVTSAPSLSCEN